MGDESFGFLDILATVATEELDKLAAEAAVGWPVIHDHCYFSHFPLNPHPPPPPSWNFKIESGSEEEDIAGVDFVEMDPVIRFDVRTSINERPAAPRLRRLWPLSPMVGSEVVLKGRRRRRAFPDSEADEEEKATALSAIKRLQDGGVSKPEFRCAVCRNRFTAYTSLLSHLRSVHLGIRAHECHLCPAKFTRKQTLAHHFKTVHDPGKRKTRTKKKPLKDLSNNKLEAV